MSDRVTRNLVVARLGTPDQTEGSLNDPVEREEHGLHFNEKWIYSHLHDDPAGAAQRTIYWHRYDFIGTMVRKAGVAEWGADPTPVEWSQRGVDRLALVASRHTALAGNPHYHPASEVRDALDLGGYIEGKKD